MTAKLNKLALYGGAGNGVLTMDGRVAGVSMANQLSVRGVDAQRFLTDAMALDKITGKADVDLSKEEARRAEADLEAADVRLAQASRDLTRAKKLAGGGGLATADLELTQQNYETQRAAVPAARAMVEKAKASVKRAQALLDKAKTNEDYTEIKSPVEGVIIDRRVNIGQTVVSALNTPSLFLLAKDLSRVQIWASVNEADIGRIQKGQKATFTVDTFPNTTFVGEVSQIRLNATMTQNVVTYTVVVTTENKDMRLLPYMTANLNFEIEHHSDVLKVPNAALRWKPRPAQIAPDIRAVLALYRLSPASVEQVRLTRWGHHRGFRKLSMHWRKTTSKRARSRFRADGTSVRAGRLRD